MAEGAPLFCGSVPVPCVELTTDADLIDMEHLRQSQLEETKGRGLLSPADNLLPHGRSYSSTSSSSLVGAIFRSQLLSLYVGRGRAPSLIYYSFLSGI